MDLSKIEKLYDENVVQFGIDAKAVGWGTKEKQYLRFQKLTEVISKTDKNISLNELGCGYGELVKYMNNNTFDLKTYYGYDISQKMLDLAKKNLCDAQSVDVELFCSPNINTSAKYTITSGIFNVRFNESKEAWQAYIESTLLKISANSSKGFSFNMLTKYVDYESPDLFYGDPLYFFDFCKKHFKKVSLLHDYSLHEFTLLVKK